MVLLGRSAFEKIRNGVADVIQELIEIGRFENEHVGAGTHGIFPVLGSHRTCQHGFGNAGKSWIVLNGKQDVPGRPSGQAVIQQDQLRFRWRIVPNALHSGDSGRGSVDVLDLSIDANVLQRFVHQTHIRRIIFNDENPCWIRQP